MPTTRPKEFDARLLAYIPGMRKHASKYTTNKEDRDNLVTDTIAKCLANWRNYREDGAFWTWIWWAMRGLASHQATKMQVELVEDPSGYFAETASTPETQTDVALLGDVIRLLKGRDGDMLLRLAKGEGLVAIAASEGISHQRVKQITDRERKRIVRLAA